MQQQKTRLIVCFGDSLTAGMVVEFGFPGMTSREMTKRVDEVLGSLSPQYHFHAFIALGGTNDLSVASSQEIVNNMNIVCEKAKRKFAHVLIGTIPIFPNLAQFTILKNKLLEANAAISKLGLPIVPFQDACAIDDDSLWSDGLHNTPKGYELMGKMAQKELQKLEMQ